MSKSAVTKLFVGSVICFIAGALIEVFAVLGTFAGGVITIGGSNVVQVNGGSFATLIVFLVLVGAALIVGAMVASFISWIGALLNTSRLDDKLWFLALLLLGLFSFGFIAMLIYVLVGPDGTKPDYAQGSLIPAARQ